jgi:predicted O-linked N-acetylglucosamine transferase (SPINDLY family)
MHDDIDAAWRAYELGQSDAAADLATRALQVNPADVQAHHLLGILEFHAGRLDTAIERFAHASRLSPDDPNLLNSLGNALREANRIADAESTYRRALALKPDFAEAWNNLGNTLLIQNRSSEAADAFGHALAHWPDFAAACNNLGRTQLHRGEIAEAIATFRRGAELSPDSQIADNFLFALHFDPTVGAEEIAREHRNWGRRLADLPPRRRLPPLPEKMSIGYISGDFRTHSVGFFLNAFLRHHDASKFEITCYSNAFVEDAMTADMKCHVARWRVIAGRSDAEVAAEIVRDRIHILVDLSGHTSGNRLGVLARRPAFVQASYLGYPDTTGSPCIDFRITDAEADPPGSERYGTEKPIRIAPTYFCFQPPADAPTVGPLPAATRAGVTFACFNAHAKINPPLVARWSRILRALPGSRLLLKNRSLGEPDLRENLIRLFAAQGIDAGRIELVGHTAGIADHLAAYGEADIALDTFPHNGATTTCEALWMGLPVVSQCGTNHASRLGRSILSAVGMADLVASDGDAYVDTAIRLASDRDDLVRRRAAMRDLLTKSPLLDGAGFARRLEDAFRTMWRKSK